MAVGHLAGDAGGGHVDLVGPLGDAVLAERHGEGAEGGRLDDVDADLEEVVVHPAMTSGRVTTSISLQPSSASPPKSSGPRPSVWT